MWSLTKWFLFVSVKSYYVVLDKSFSVCPSEIMWSLMKCFLFVLLKSYYVVLAEVFSDCPCEIIVCGP